MRPDPNYPRWMFHRSLDPVMIHSPEEEAALGPEWSRRVWAALSREEKPEPVPEPYEEPEEPEEPVVDDPAQPEPVPPAKPKRGRPAAHKPAHTAVHKRKH